MPAAAKPGARPMSDAAIVEAYMWRETTVKDICVELAKRGKLKNTWGSGNRKPRDDTIIKLKTNGT